MSKLALYWSIRVKCYRPHVVKVTSVKKRSWGHDRWYGSRPEYEEATNGKVDQLRGQFATQAEAEKMLESVAAIEAEYEAKRKVLQD